MIRLCTEADIPAILDIVNDAAQAYRGVIPTDCWHEPYMSESELRHEIGDGVAFYGWQEGGELIGVMGLQPVDDVALIRHAYVRSAHRGKGIGTVLLALLRSEARAPLLVGTWAAATWAIGFYQKYGFALNTPEETRSLLRRYWKISARQLETSVVLSDSHGQADKTVDDRRQA